MRNHFRLSGSFGPFGFSGLSGLFGLSGLERLDGLDRLDRYVGFIVWSAVPKGNMLEKSLTRNCQSQMPKSKCQMKSQCLNVKTFKCII